jgi:energy-coupling factor transporter ATP-binding protein EcfA2
MKLNNLYIKSFRGATKPITIEFDSSKKISMIFGENGNGKSTIADAFICLLTEKMGSLDDKSSVDTSFLKSLGTGTGETKIALTTDTGTFLATLSGATKTFTKTPSTGLPSLRFIRRSQIINLMNAQATSRYETLKDYIDVSGIYASEEELRKTVRDTDQNLTTATSVLHNANETLEKTWIKEGKPDGKLLDWAKAQSQADISKDLKNYQTLSDLLNQWRAIDSKHKEIIQAKTNTKISLQTKQNAEAALKQLQSSNSKNNASLLSLLQVAKAYIAAQPIIDKCPVCTNGIKKETVVASLDKQIKSMDDLEKASKLLDTTSKTHDRNLAILNKAIDTINAIIIKYKLSISKYKEKIPEIVAFVDGIEKDASANYNCFTQNLTQLQNLNTRIEDSAKAKNKSIQQYNFIKEHYTTITVNLEKVGKLAALKTAATKALNIVETTRKEFYDNELLSISANIEEMYQKLHRSEGLGGIKLFLNPKYKTSLELQANFHTIQGITPQSVYSESHLDTLGTCIFLALAKKYSDGNTMLLLDDVVMSVDENHLDKFIELLHDEAVNFSQIIITTHYRPWKDRYKNNRAPSSNVHFLELRNWSKENGINVFNGKIALDELRKMLSDEASFDRENISTAAGRTLENILDFLTLKFSSKVPRKPKNDYQLSELLDGLSKELLKLLKVEHYSKDEQGKFTTLVKQVDLKPTIDILKQLKAVRNQVGAHYNFDGSLVGDSDIKAFGNATVEFAELLICPVDGNLPDRNKSGSYWETKNGSIHLFPLIEP